MCWQQFGVLVTIGAGSNLVPIGVVVSVSVVVTVSVLATDWCPLVCW